MPDFEDYSQSRTVGCLDWAGHVRRDQAVLNTEKLLKKHFTDAVFLCLTGAKDNNNEGARHYAVFGDPTLVSTAPALAEFLEKFTQ